MAFGVEIHAFEPVSQNVDILKSGIQALMAERSGGTGVTLKVHHFAVVDDPALTEVPFGVCADGEEVCGVEKGKKAGDTVKAGNAGSVRVSYVNATTIDQMSERLGINTDIIDVLAIDVEGMDPGVMRGARKLLGAGRVRVLEFEYNNMRLWTTEMLKDVTDELAELGYDCFYMQQTNLIRITGCWSPKFEAHYWSNVMCVRRADEALLALLSQYMPPLGDEAGGTMPVWSSPEENSN
jgi:FkbM family methyltransferase